MTDVIKTIFGTFTPSSKRRLDLTFDYETCAIRSFREIAACLGAEVVIDIGANIGVYSVYVSDLPSVEAVHAFEPAPEALKALRENVALQPHGKITCHGSAASSENGHVRFHIVSPMAGNNAVVCGEVGTGEVIEVPTCRLDDMVQVSGRRLCLKIDVEGHECETLAGAAATLRSNGCFLQVEVLREAGAARVRKIMEDLGFLLLFSLQNDLLFLSSSLRDRGDEILAIVARNLSADLHDLTVLRTEKRQLALQAKKLRQMASYSRDPLLA